MNRTQVSRIASAALALVMLSAYVAHRAVQSRWSRNVAGVDVIVAARDLQTGTALSETDLMVTEVRAKAAPPHCFHDTSTLLGHTMLLPVSKGEVIFPYEVGGDGDSFRLGR